MVYDCCHAPLKPLSKSRHSHPQRPLALRGAILDHPFSLAGQRRGKKRHKTGFERLGNRDQG